MVSPTSTCSGRVTVPLKLGWLTCSCTTLSEALEEMVCWPTATEFSEDHLSQVMPCLTWKSRPSEITSPLVQERIDPFRENFPLLLPELVNSHFTPGARSKYSVKSSVSLYPGRLPSGEGS